MNLLTPGLFVLAFVLSGRRGIPEEHLNRPPARDSLLFEFEEVTGIGYEKAVSRRDPSDIIRVGDRYYVWYTKIPAGNEGHPTPLYNSGYSGTIWYATSTDGRTWVEQGQTLGPGDTGAFDAHAVFTPNILKYHNRYYLYYTGVKPTPGNPDNKFENNSETDITAIGVAVSDSPDGNFRRISRDPVLRVSHDADAFDSYRVDDAALLRKGNEIWLYYKGRSRMHHQNGPRYTRMGVAFATKPEGPFTKHAHPLLGESHEVLVWSKDDGVASLTSINKSIYFAADGLNFSLLQDQLSSIPVAPGLYRPHLTDDSMTLLPGWGISHAVRDGDVYLVRFKMH